MSLPTTITVMKPVSCDHVTSFNYDNKKARDVGVTCWCNLRNIMPDSIFHKSMRQGITCSVLFRFFVWFFCICLLYALIFLQSDTSVFLRMKEMESVYYYSISECGEILNYNGHRQMRLISLQWDLRSETCQGILD